MKKEVVSLYLVQISNILIPLLTFPYLVRVLGIEGFGRISFAQTVFLIFSFFIDFGFNLSGAKSVSIYTLRKKSIDKIYTNIIIFKFIIYFILFFIVMGIFSINNISFNEKILILMVYIFSFSSILIPNFIFNGLGINSKLAIITLVIKIIFLIPIFLFVKSKSDVFLAAFLILFPNLIIGVISQIYLIIKNIINFSFKSFKWRLCLNLAINSYHNFSASFFTLGFTYSTPLMVKFFLGDTALGIYSMVDKLINIMRQLYLPIIQAFYAKICSAYVNNKSLYRDLLKKVTLIFVFIGLSSLVANLILGDFILRFIFGYIPELHYLLTIAIITQILVSIAMVVVNFYILPSGKSFIMKKIYFSALALFFPIFYLCIKSFSLNGVFYSIQIVEFLISLYFLKFMYDGLKNKKLSDKFLG